MPLPATVPAAVPANVPARALRAPIAILSVLAVLATALVAAVPARATTGELFFSEYVEGSSNNKALEIYNGTGAPVDLGLSGYNVAMFFNGGVSAGLTVNLTGTVADGDVFVLAQASASPAILAQADQVSVASWYNGDDAVVLRRGTAVVDSIGQVGVDPGTEWGTGLTSTADNALRRKPDVLAGDTNPGDAFDPASGWEGFATDTFDGLGTHTVTGDDAAPTVASTTPAGGATSVPVAGDVTVTFSEPVDVAGTWFTISCADSGAHSATATGGPTSYTLDPGTDFGFGETCSVTVAAAQVTDRDAVDPPDTMAADHTFSFSTVAQDPCDAAYTPIHEIQGSGPVSPADGQVRSTEGVVVGDFQGPSGMNGFFVQDPDADGDPQTSEGIFVFVPASSALASVDVSVGDRVHVRGRVTEFQSETELGNVDQLVVCGPGAAISPTTVDLPEATDGELEAVEGMLATFPDTFTVQQNFFQGRFGQLTLGVGGRLHQPTNQFPAGSAEAVALADLNRRSMIVLDDHRTSQNPNPVPYLPADGVRRAGDSVSGLTGVVDHGAVNSNTSIRDYRIQPTTPPVFANDNPRTPGPEPVGGNLTVASFNVLNYFTTFPSQNPDARGANNAEEFDRQRAKIFAAMAAIDADVFGLMEIENLPGTDAVQNLVDGLNASVGDPGRYAALTEPAGTDTGDDAIKVAMVYQPARVQPVGESLRDNAAINDRPPLAQAFRLLRDGEVVNVVVNHFKSKGSCPSSSTDPDADQGDGQGCWNAKRVRQAEQLRTFLDRVSTASGDEDVLVIGDLNSYGEEDPVRALKAAGLHDEIDRYVGDTAYSYVFDGLSGYLDHGLASEHAHGQVVGATEWHINADEPSVIDYNTEFKPDDRWAPTPYRSSDHDPVVLGVDLGRCQFSDDAAARTRTLLGDCSTSRTVLAPDGWVLDGAGHTISAYDPEDGHFRGAVVANGGAVAHVRDLTVTAYRLADVCDDGADRLRGILLDGASGSITGNRVVGVAQAGSGCQEGNGIEVRNAPFDRSGPDLAVSVSGNEVRGYQKGGVVANGSVLATVTGNTVQGAGPVGQIAQNGIQLGFGATGTVDGNQVTDNWYTGPDVACGLLFFDADGVKQKRNTFAGNERDVCNFGRGGGSVQPTG